MNLAEELRRYGPDTDHPTPTLHEARAYCRQLAESHYENFTVASRLFPSHLQQHLCNVYAYCRWADDLADETPDPARSLELLAWWEGELGAINKPPAPLSPCGRGAGGEGLSRQHPVFIALAETIREFAIPQKPFSDLLVAFRRDQEQSRYATFADLLTYCQCSANPVGQIVLALGRSTTDENARLSDSICTGLQLANFCQDVARDWKRGRVYLPQDECHAVGWSEARFAVGKCDDAFRELLKQQVERAEKFLLAGQPLVEHVGRDLRLPVRLFVTGGLAILAAIRLAGYDVLSRRPTVSRWTKLRLLASAWWQG
ncbi:MAG: squalene synthase HpnC [Pirellulaceae bacterium]|nr:squalene synthase HpnC [Pirellulaceae bacterium]